jgi:hypothetical protein
MNAVRGSLAALVLAGASLTGLSASQAHAATPQTTYVSHYVGPSHSQATCNEASAADNAPPSLIAFPCFFSQTRPVTGTPAPGWYFRLDSAIGIPPGN